MLDACNSRQQFLYLNVSKHGWLLNAAQNTRLMGFRLFLSICYFSVNAAWLYLWQMRGGRVFHKGPLGLRRLFLLFQEEIVPTLLLFRVLE